MRFRQSSLDHRYLRKSHRAAGYTIEFHPVNSDGNRNGVLILPEAVDEVRTWCFEQFGPSWTPTRNPQGVW